MAEPALAAHLTVYVKPYSVDLTTQGALAVGEEVPVEVRGIKDGMAVSNWIGAVTRGTNVVGVCTNLVLGTNNVATGSVDCATREMGALFDGASPLAERDVTLTFCERFNETGDFRLVASGSATVRNNPLSPEAVDAFAPTGEHLWDSALFAAMREWGRGFFVAKTNGEWVIVQSADWTGLEWGGERVFGAVLDVHDGGGMAQITGLSVTATNELVLSFRGAATNHLEACNDYETWETWNGCTWAYGDEEGVGTVTVHGADPDYWYRVAADGAVASWSNAAMVSYAPLYAGSVADSNRVATVGQLEAAKKDEAAQRRRVAANAVPRLRYEDAMEIGATNVAWEFTADEPYIRNLRIGGQVIEWDEVEEGVTNTYSVTNWGILNFNGVEIGSWMDLKSILGSGFPLEEDADFGGNSATNVAGIQFDGSTNVLAISDGKLRYGGKSISGVANLAAGQNIALSTNDATEAVTVATTDNVSFNDVQVRGDLTIYGQQNINTIRRYYTNVYLGVQTNFVTTEIHTTNHVAQVMTVTTRTTNHVDQVINVGGDQDYSLAASVLSPSYRIDNSDTNNPVLTGVGTWNLSACNVDLGALLPTFVSTGAVASVNGWKGNVEFAPGTNIVFSTNLAAKRITVNATVPEIDLSPYATNGRVAAVEERVGGVEARAGTIETNIANHTGGMANYVTEDGLTERLQNYAPASEITVITTNIEEIVSALSNPVIQTPDRKKWTMQGRYAGGQVTHVWVPYVGVYSSPFRVAMPDGRIFEMVGRYADGNTNLVTHVWEEVAE